MENLGHGVRSLAARGALRELGEEPSIFSSGAPTVMMPSANLPVRWR
jgi:hypothetical protein